MEINTTMAICPKGHSYDTAKYKACPICGARAAGRASTVPTGGFTATEPVGGAGGFTATEPVGGAGGFGATEPVQNAAFGRTEPVSHSAAGGAYRGAGSTIPAQEPDRFVNTMSAGSISGGMGGTERIDPVVGWLVCIEGPCRGQDFRLHGGYNYIGRSVGDVCISGDLQISNERHAVVAYYGKNRTFYVGPADGKNIIEVNDAPVINATSLQSYDVITLGSTQLLFVPLCCEKCGWPTEGAANV